MQQRPRLGTEPGGGLRIAWYDGRHADWRWRVRSAVLAPAATAFGPAGDLSSAGSSTFPAVDGGFVTWATDRGAAPQRDLTQRVVLADTRPAATGPATPAALPEAPLAALLPVAGAAAAAAGAAMLARRSRSVHRDVAGADARDREPHPS